MNDDIEVIVPMLIRQIIRYLPEPIVIISAQDRLILESNQAFQELTGMDSGQLRIRKISDWIAPGDQHGFCRMLRVASRRRLPVSWDDLWRTPLGKHLCVNLLAHRIHISADPRPLVQLVIRDLTEKAETQTQIGKYVDELTELKGKLETLVTIDETTGLANHRQFKRQLQMEHSRAARYKEEFSLLLVKLDNFEDYRKKHGAQCASESMRQLGAVVSRCCRVSDFQATLFNDEIGLICPRTPAKKAIIVADRIREAVQSRPFRYGGMQPQGRITASVGVACFPHDASTTEELLSEARAALELSHQKGGNQSSTASKVSKGRGRLSRSLFGH